MLYVERLGNEKFSNLNYLIGAYFHQDWGLDFQNDSDLVRFFGNEHSKERVEGCLKDISELVTSNLSDAQIVYLLEEVFAGHLPHYANVRTWLENIAKALQQTIHFG